MYVRSVAWLPVNAYPLMLMLPCLVERERWSSRLRRVKGLRGPAAPFERRKPKFSFSGGTCCAHHGMTDAAKSARISFSIGWSLLSFKVILPTLLISK